MFRSTTPPPAVVMNGVNDHNAHGNDHELPIPLGPKEGHKFYEPIMLLASLIEASKKTATRGPPEPKIDLANDEQIFQAFVNKLSHICDYEKGGETVTAFGFLHGGNDEPVRCFFAANNQEWTKLQATAAYVRELLRKASQVTANTVDQIRRDLLYDVIRFNRPRVTSYLRALEEQVATCIEVCQRKANDESKSQGIHEWRSASS